MIQLLDGEVHGAPQVWEAESFEDAAHKILHKAKSGGPISLFPTLYDTQAKVIPPSAFTDDGFVDALCEEPRGDIHVHIQEVQIHTN